MTSEEQRAGTATLEMLGRYQLLAKLGQGGMGAVYLANDTKLDRRVAIKVLPAQSVNDPDAVARFQREGKALAKLAHAGIVQAFDTEEDNGRHFLVMEFVEGKSLGDVLKEQGKVSPTRAADYIHQAALALQHAHERGLVHRDLKPSNLLLTAQGQVKVLDLGLARFLQDQITDPARTREGMGLGTPDYAAPEQFRHAHAADARSDVYALGCTLYHLLTGRVPFPGSSLSEKYAAHQNMDAAPVEEMCPDVPGGLCLVVARMMAKRSADRFQSARDVADALAPYIAGASASFARLKSTSTWDRGQLTMRDFHSRRGLLPWAIAGAAVAALILLTVFAWPRLFPPASPPPEPDDDRQASADNPNKEQEAPKKDGKIPDKPKPAPGKTPPADDPDVLTVSQDKKDGGKYGSIVEALREVKAGQTIRIIDGAVYREPVLLISGTNRAGITLEATGGAIIEATRERASMIVIQGVPGVTLRGLRLRAAAKSPTLVAVGGDSPGTTLEGLDMDTRGGGYNGIEVVGRGVAKPGHPITVRGCTIRRPHVGVIVMGTLPDYSAVTPIDNVVVRDNVIAGPLFGVYALGELRRVSLVGNRVLQAQVAGLQLEQLLPGTEKVLVANNTTFNCHTGFRVWDSEARGKEVRVCNNLLLGSDIDMLFVNSGGQPKRSQGPGDGAALARVWTIRHNWRERGPDDKDKPGRIPDRDDVVKKVLSDAVNRDSKAPDFLRPDKDSPLVTSGAGREDPSLPIYIGAIPPEGVEPWDWDRTRRMPRDAKLLTVSKDKADGGEFRTIGAALAKAEPWATIRVLDNKVYEETLVLDNTERHEGIMLEAPKRATIKLADDPTGALVIDNVPHVTVRGFRVHSSAGAGIPPFVTVTAHSPGVMLADLHIQSSRPKARAIVLKDLRIQSSEAPVVVKRCTMEVRGQALCDGIVVEGPSGDGDSIIATGTISIHDNRIAGAFRGIMIQGKVADVQVTGNLLWKCKLTALQLEDLAEGAARILMANNSAFDCSTSLRVWDYAPFKKHPKGQVELRNNLLFNASEIDLIWVLDPHDGSEQKPGDGRSLVNAWWFSHNWRDLSGARSGRDAIPLAPGDHQLKGKVELSRDPSSADFLRPPSSSPLANDGAGKEDPSLPTYVGAVPPKGVDPWDWDRTWRARAKKSLAKK
jgi:serine/threonine protein kinase